MQTGSRVLLTAFGVACLGVWGVALPVARVEAKPASYLPAGAVDVAALRRAVAETIETFGRRYPKGRQVLRRLAELASVSTI